MFEHFQKKFPERLTREDLIQTTKIPTQDSDNFGQIVQTIIHEINENNDRDEFHHSLSEIKDLVKQVKCVSNVKTGLLVPYVPLIFLMSVLLTSLVVVLTIRHCKNRNLNQRTDLISNRDDYVQRSSDL